MSPRPSIQKRMLSICGPALGVVLAYNFAFFSPLQRSLKVERTKLQKMEAAFARRSNSASLTDKLAKAEADIRFLNEQISSSKQIGSHLVSRRDGLRNEYLQSNAPAMAMAETLALLSRHGLQCINSSPAAPEKSAPLSDSLKPVATLLADASSASAELLDRREMRITLRGRFQDIQSALREIQVAPLGVFTVSLEMESSDAHTDVRIWILTIAV